MCVITQQTTTNGLTEKLNKTLAETLFTYIDVEQNYEVVTFTDNTAKQDFLLIYLSVETLDAVFPFTLTT